MPTTNDTHRSMISIPNELLSLLRERLSETDRLMAVAPLSAIVRYLAAKEAGIPEDQMASYVYPKRGPKGKTQENVDN